MRNVYKISYLSLYNRTQGEYEMEDGNKEIRYCRDQRTKNAKSENDIKLFRIAVALPC
jgi:hypothetical protein